MVLRAMFDIDQYIFFFEQWILISVNSKENVLR